MRGARGIRAAASVVAVVLVATACTSGGEEHRGTGGPVYHPTGQMVLLAGQFGSQIALMDVATGKALKLNLPAAGGSYDNVWPAADGRFYGMPLVFSATSSNQLFLLGGGKPAERIGPPIGGVIGFQVLGGHAVAWGCPGVFVLDLADPTVWKRVSGGCTATLSPDGNRVAYTGGSSIWVMDLPDGTPREVVRLGDLEELRRAHIPRRALEAMTWGDPGLAVAVGDASRSALVVWSEGRPPFVYALGPVRVGEMRWQPGGDLLAFAEYAPNGEVLTLDPRTGRERQLASVGDFGRLSWSPDGRVVGASVSRNIVTLVDPQRGHVGTVTTPGLPVAWMAGPS
jgi:hypothetical protein